MNQAQCYISANGQEEGPISFDEVVQRLAAGHLQLSDFLYDEKSQDWVPLLEVPEVVAFLKSRKPKSQPKTATAKTTIHSPAKTSGADSREWFVMKWDDRLGPFSLTDLVRMLQEKQIFEFDCVWKKGMESWVRIAELETFAAESVKEKYAEVLMKRRHKRVKVEGPLLIHNEKTLWKGHTLELSEGGAGVVMNNSVLLPGESVLIHFQGSEKLEAFNAKAEIVNKKYVKGVRDRSAPITYALRFVGEDDELVDQIRKVTTRAV